MRIDIQIDPACTEPRIVVHTDRMSGEIAALLEKLEAPRMLMGFRDEKAAVLDPAGILRAYCWVRKPVRRRCGPRLKILWGFLYPTIMA